MIFEPSFRIEDLPQMAHVMSGPRQSVSFRRRNRDGMEIETQ